MDTSTSPTGPFVGLWVIAAAVIAAFGFSLEARADEAYVCDDGRIVYVKFGQLESLRRTDPCIAAHFARRHGAGEISALRSAPMRPEQGQQVAVEAPPLPVRPAMTKESGMTGDVIVVHEQRPADAGAVLAPRVERVVFPYVRTQRPRSMARNDLPEVPIDFRNIPIINAQPGAPQIFHHAR